MKNQLRIVKYNVKQCREDHLRNLADEVELEENINTFQVSSKPNLNRKPTIPAFYYLKLY